MAVIIIIIFSIFSLNQSSASTLPKFVIKDCYDGDTFTTTKGEKIRLACIDTPELKEIKAKPIKAKESKSFLNDLVNNQELYLKRITNDRYSRTVGELFKEGINIQKMIFKKGHGKIYKKYSHQCEWSR